MTYLWSFQAHLFSAGNGVLSSRGLLAIAKLMFNVKQAALYSVNCRVVLSRGLYDIGAHAVFRPVFVGKITYASSAWSGFITASDRQRVDAFLRRTKRCRFCSANLPSFDELLQDADENLLNIINNNVNRLLHSLLPPPSVASEHY